MLYEVITHEQRTDGSKDEELDGSVDSVFTTPDADHEIHGDQHQFPENVEEEQIKGNEGAQHGRITSYNVCYTKLLRESYLIDPRRYGCASGIEQSGVPPKNDGYRCSQTLRTVFPIVLSSVRKGTPVNTR